MTFSKEVVTVSELTYAIKSQLEKNFRSICVQGEISNFKKQSSGHLYFSLKDKESQLSAALFRMDARKLSKIPKDGDQVIVKGDISVYPPRGNYQMIVRELSFLGIGQLLLQLHQLKTKLHSLGWFDTQHKKILPLLPKKIGVVTSPTGAVIQDILHVLTRRFSGVHIILNPVKVQGDGAAKEIAQAIEDFNKYSLADVLIIGRGGGSLEDLFAFNEEIVAKAIFDSKIPIISAVGHETDTSIADYVADIRAPTPSAAAEIVIKEKSDLKKTLHSYQQQIAKITTHRLDFHSTKLKSLLSQPAFSSSSHLFGKQMQQLDDIRSHINICYTHFLEQKKEKISSYKKQLHALNPLSQIAFLQEKLFTFTQNIEKSWSNLWKIKKGSFIKENYEKKLDFIIKKHLDAKKENISQVFSLLSSIDPKNLLKKGYSILFSEKTNSPILSCKDIQKDEIVVAMLIDGKMKATVNQIFEKEKA